MPYRDMPIEPWMIDLIKALIQVRQHTRKDGTTVRAHQRNIMTHGEKKDLVSKMAAALAKHGKLDVSEHSAHHVHKAAAEVARQTGKHVVIHRDADGKLHVQHDHPGDKPHMAVFRDGKTLVHDGQGGSQEVTHHEAQRALRVKKAKQLAGEGKPEKQKAVAATKPAEPDHPGMLADPHLMTYAQYQQSAWSDLTGPTTVRSHKEYIRDALQAGKDVPAHVMDEHDGYGHQAKKEIEESRERVKNSERIAKERGWTTDSDYAGEKKMARDEAKREKAAAKGQKPAPATPEKPAAFSNPTHALLQLIADHPRTVKNTGLDVDSAVGVLGASPVSFHPKMGKERARALKNHPAFGVTDHHGTAKVVRDAIDSGLLQRAAGDSIRGLSLTEKGKARLAEMSEAASKAGPKPAPKKLYTYGLRDDSLVRDHLPPGRVGVSAHPVFAHGAVEYDRELTPEEVSHYGLDRLTSKGRSEIREDRKAAEVLGNEPKDINAEYLHEKLDMAKEDHPAEFAEALEHLKERRPDLADSIAAWEQRTGGSEAKPEPATSKAGPVSFSSPTHAMLQLIADHPQTAQKSGLSPLMVEYAMRGEHIGRSQVKGVGEHPAFGHMKDEGAGEAADLVSRAQSEGLVAKTAGLYPGLGLTTKGQARLAELGGAPAPRPKRAPEPTPKVEPPAPAPKPKAKAAKEAPAAPAKTAREVTFDRPSTKNSDKPYIRVRDNGSATHELQRGENGWSFHDRLGRKDGKGYGHKLRDGMTQSEAMEYARAYIAGDQEALDKFHQHDAGVPLAEMPKQSPHKLKKVMNVSSDDGKKWHSDGFMASTSPVNPRDVAPGVQPSDAIGARIEQMIPKQVAPVKPVAYATDSKAGSAAGNGHVVFDNGASMDARMYQHLMKQHPGATWHQDPSSTLTPFVLQNRQGDYVALAMPKQLNATSNIHEVADRAAAGHVFAPSKPAPKMDPASSLAKSWRFAGGGGGGGDA